MGNCLQTSRAHRGSSTWEGMFAGLQTAFCRVRTTVTMRHAHAHESMWVHGAQQHVCRFKLEFLVTLLLALLRIASRLFPLQVRRPHALQTTSINSADAWQAGSRSQAHSQHAAAMTPSRDNLLVTTNDSQVPGCAHYKPALYLP